jgi:hypothetical protein
MSPLVALGDLPDGAACDARHHHRQPGNHYRHLFDDASGHAARLVPGVRIRQTSDEEYGQIYVPFVNWTIMAFTIALTVGFASSDRLAGAYGTAVSTTMLLTTVLLYHVMRERWGWWGPAALAVGSILILVDFTLFAANLAKIRDGGWIPLAFGTLVFATMATWRYGMDALQARQPVPACRPKYSSKNCASSKCRGSLVPRSSLPAWWTPLRRCWSAMSSRSARCRRASSR